MNNNPPTHQSDAPSSEQLELLFDSARGELLGTLYYLIGNMEDAKDALQETFLECWKKQEQLDSIDNLKAWVFRIALNTGRDIRKTAWKRRRQSLAELELVAEGNNGLPYSIEVLYHTLAPPTDDRCPFELTTKFDSTDGDDGRVNSGATLKVKATLRNKTDQGKPMAVATIGLPGGLEPRVEQLDELRDAGMFDFYKVRPREVTCYWRTIAPDATKEISFDVTAEVSGKYTGPASRAYLYYTAEQKVWTQPLVIEIGK